MSTLAIPSFTLTEIHAPSPFVQHSEGAYSITYQEYASGAAAIGMFGYILHEIVTDDSKIPLAKPLNVLVCGTNEGVHAENEELTTFGSGRTIEEAMGDFSAALMDSWEGLKGEDESTLSADAVDLKRRLSAYFMPA